MARGKSRILTFALLANPPKGERITFPVSLALRGERSAPAKLPPDSFP